MDYKGRLEINVNQINSHITIHVIDNRYGINEEIHAKSLIHFSLQKNKVKA